MVILVTGSAGHLGEGLVRMLREKDVAVRGLDRLDSEYTDIVGSIVDPVICQAAMQGGVSAVLHTASLHKPHVVMHSMQDFIDTNITGTLNLLQAAVNAGTVKKFIFTSTTSSFGHALKSKDGTTTWIDESVVPVPKNIYGATKCAAEDLCQLFYQLHKLPCIVLKVSRFFPEDDDDTTKQSFCSIDNAKVNELLNRRADLYDMCTAHLAALEKATELGFDKFIISSATPFDAMDLADLAKDAPAVVARHYPNFYETYRKLGWRLETTLDRVYDSGKARRLLEWTPVYTFGYALHCAQEGKPYNSDLARQVGKKMYHRGGAAQASSTING